MERHTVSRHEVDLYTTMKTDNKWRTVRELAALSGIAQRTANRHCARLTELGILDVSILFPGYQYRLSEHAEERNKAYFSKLEKAAQVFGQVSGSN